jgi:hypothetical protein
LISFEWELRQPVPPQISICILSSMALPLS